MPALLRSLYLWACDRLYHELAPGYDVVSRLVSLGAWPVWRRTVIPYLRGARLLELGFGTGELLAELARLAAAGEVSITTLAGLERAGEMHAVAARRFAAPAVAPREMAARAGPFCVQATAEVMPFASGAFDTVVATFPAPYILAESTLAECARVLSPGGRLLIAGLWVRLHDPRLRALVPVFYADPSAAAQETIAQHVAAAGFAVHWQHREAGWADIPILVGDKL
jgi:ubiquinone/menaquinone biosynthesis C-methylase UbiE